MLNNIFYSDLCSAIPVLNQQAATCESFNDNVLQKGLYASLIMYWDYLKHVNYDFSKQTDRELIFALT